MFSGVGDLTATGVGTWEFHHIRAPKQPIHAYFKAVGDLADAVQIESAQHTNGLNVNGAPAADAPINSIRLHARMRQLRRNAHGKRSLSLRLLLLGPPQLLPLYRP